MLLYYNKIIQEGYCYSIRYFTFHLLERISSIVCGFLIERGDLTLKDPIQFKGDINLSQEYTGF